jgi:hypothetical protein
MQTSMANNVWHQKKVEAIVVELVQKSYTSLLAGPRGYASPGPMQVFLKKIETFTRIFYEVFMLPSSY